VESNPGPNFGAYQHFEIQNNPVRHLECFATPSSNVVAASGLVGHVRHDNLPFIFTT
jgi:hypothetical protein